MTFDLKLAYRIDNRLELAEWYNNLLNIHKCTDGIGLQDFNAILNSYNGYYDNDQVDQYTVKFSTEEDMVNFLMRYS